MNDSHEIHIPSAVRRQGEQADKLQADLIAAAGKTGEPSAPAQAPATPNQPGGAPQTPDPRPQAAPAQDEDFRHKYAVLQAKYSAEVPRLNATIRDLTRQTEQLGEEVKRLTEAAEAAKQMPSSPDPKLNPERFAEYGEEFTDLATEVKNLRSAMSELRKENDTLKGRVGSTEQTVKVTAQDRFNARLAELIPQLAEQDPDPDFLAWLVQPNPYGAGTRHDALLAARDLLNADRVAAIFNEFAALSGKYGKSGASAPSQSPNPLERQVQPGGGRSGAPDPAKTNKKVYTRAEVDAFYHDLKLGHYRGREDEAKRIEDDIFEANRQGRIRS